jgi:putative transposase
VKRLCASVALSRASSYRGLRRRDPEPETLALRDQIQKIALAFPAYGYRRITAELAGRGWSSNHKRVLRLLRQDNLLCLRRRKSFLPTTDSGHAFPVFANLAARLRSTAINQLWVADITYIRLRREFVYLAVVLDAYSRRVWVGLWDVAWKQN